MLAGGPPARWLAAPLLAVLSFRAAVLLSRLPPHTHAPLKRAHRTAGAAALAASAAAAFLGVGHPAVSSPWLTPVWRGAIGVLACVGVAAAHAPTAVALESFLARGLEAVGLPVASPDKAF